MIKKKEFAHLVKEKLGLRSLAEAKRQIDQLFECIQSVCQRHDGVQTCIGRFKMKNKPERTGRNPKTGESIQIPPSKKIVFIMKKGILETHVPEQTRKIKL